MKLVVTIDTEGDNQWDHGAPLTTRNVAFWQPFMDLCVRHSVRPTYLVTTEIIDDGAARDLLRRWSQEELAEVGAHLHPWTTPPFVDEPGLRSNDPAHAFPSSLPDNLLRAKLAALTDQIEAGMGVRPTSFRAGRFGFDTRCAQLLAELGYVVDSSVTPLISWRGIAGLPAGPGGPDHSAHSVRPFLIAGVGGRGLLELPVTIMYSCSWASRHPWATRFYLSQPARLARRLSNGGRPLPEPMWLRPFPGVRASDLKRFCWRARDSGLQTLVMMFHSSELMPGCSPYRPTRRSVTALLALLDEFFAFVSRSGGSFATLTEAANDAMVSSPPVSSL
jgi:hypothetical protein